MGFPNSIISCPSTTTCFAGVGEDPYGTILATTNRGKTWVPQSTGRLGVAGISCPSTTTCFAVGSTSMILATTNGGKTWTRLSVIPKCVVVINHATTACEIDGISCPSVTTCAAVTENGTVLVTTNGGRKWTSQITPAAKLPKDPPGLALLYRIDCPNATICFAVGDNGTILRWRK